MSYLLFFHEGVAADRTGIFHSCYHPGVSYNQQQDSSNSRFKKVSAVDIIKLNGFNLAGSFKNYLTDISK